MPTVMIINGAGTGEFAANTNGGGYNPESAQTWTTCQGANGGPVHNNAGCTIENTGDDLVTLRDNGNFATGLAGIIARPVFTHADYAAVTGLAHEITASDVDTITINTPFISTNGTATAVVGGAINGDPVGLILCWLAMSAPGDTLKITGTFDSATAANVLDGASYASGTESARMTVEGVDPTTGERLTVGAARPIFHPADAGGRTSLISIQGNIDYWDWYFLDFNGTNGAYTANYGVYCNDTNSQLHRFYNCKFHHCIWDNFRTTGTFWSLINGECYSNTTAALRNCYWLGTYGLIVGCSFHDSAPNGYGMLAAGDACLISNNNVYGNGVGIGTSGSGDWNYIVNNVCYNNSGDGFKVDSTSDTFAVYNNSSVNNGGYAYNLNQDIDHFAYFGHNHAHGTNVIAGTSQGLHTDGDASYIDLNTTSGYLNGLREAKWAIISIMCPHSANAISDRYISMEGAAGIYFFDSSGSGDLRFEWAGTNVLRLTAASVTEDVTHNMVVVADISGENDSWLRIDSDAYTASDTLCSGLDAADAGKIRLGAAADDAAGKAIADFGFFAILDLSSITTVDSTFAEELAAAVNTACGSTWNPATIQAAIVNYDNYTSAGTIAGTCWYLNNKTTGLLPRDVADGTAKTTWPVATLTGPVHEASLAVNNATDMSPVWTDVGNGNNVVGDPKFKDPLSGDFTPQANSPLLAAGMPTAHSSVTNYAHIGAVTPKRPRPRLIRGGASR